MDPTVPVPPPPVSVAPVVTAKALTLPPWAKLIGSILLSFLLGLLAQRSGITPLPIAAVPPAVQMVPLAQPQPIVIVVGAPVGNPTVTGK